MAESIDVFYNRILKIARQCEFPDMDDRIIDATNLQNQLCKSSGQTAPDSKNFIFTTVSFCS